MNIAALRAAKRTYISIEITYNNDDLFLTLAGSGTAIIDWGDGMPECTLEIREQEYREWTDILDETDRNANHSYDGCGKATITVAGHVTACYILTHAALLAMYADAMPCLRFLMCDTTGLTALNVGKNINLEEIDCDNAMLTAIDITCCPSLQYLACSRNRLSNVALIEIIKSLPDRNGKWPYGIIAFNDNPLCEAILEEATDLLNEKNWEIQIYTAI